MMPLYKRREDVPQLKLAVQGADPFPRPITKLHQIELTSRCSLACVYCPNPAMKRSLPLADGNIARPAVDMSAEHYALALDWVRFFHMKRETQTELNLAGIGESMMREDFVERVEQARRVLGEKIILLMATNGLHLTEGIAQDLARLKFQLWISLHRPEKARVAMEIAARHGILVGVSNDPAMASDDWAGQVNWFYSQAYVSGCMWMREGAAIALADGRVTMCCLDASGKGVVGHLQDDPAKATTQPSPLCKTCHQEIAVEGYTQR